MTAAHLARCDRLLPRSASGRSVPWSDFCSPDGPWLTGCVDEWQARGGFTHHRAAVVLVAFRAGWLACCATIPEVHFGLPVPDLATASAVLGPDGGLAGLSTRRSHPLDARGWWHGVEAFFAPLARSLTAMGARDAELWGNPVGLIGAVARRMADGGLPGDLLATASALRDATGRPGLLTLAGTADDWRARRRTCCQWWRAGGGYCAECVLHDSPARAR
ncbi:(2Fe-2S)-binding protein [Umezawaea tangerina]|uniref:FhuF-like iron-sulfur protein n=1 Tax=Umezawaea tangerina TaxID=84725 RepID=A0A2T0TAT0_9PSEU|nr:(2Fe-2S)-binding protein [Umezawaea tangerina]PRY42767.1 FhuF-like iron-sulfur protein [Umezawaea tangerina]